MTETERPSQRIGDAYRQGDMDALRAALDNPPDFPNCRQPAELAAGEYPLEYAIYWSPLAFIEALLDLGADPNYPDQSGFPSILATLSTDRRDKNEILTLLLDRGADVQQRGHNDWTPLHHAVALRDGKAIKLLLERGADAAARTRIDEYSTPLEDAEAIGYDAGAEAIRQAMHI